MIKWGYRPTIKMDTCKYLLLLFGIITVYLCQCEGVEKGEPDMQQTGNKQIVLSKHYICIRFPLSQFPCFQNNMNDICLSLQSKKKNVRICCIAHFIKSKAARFLCSSDQINLIHKVTNCLHVIGHQFTLLLLCE